MIGVEESDGTVAGERPAGGLDALVAPPVYRPHLDGLRAVAVYLVVLFHAGLYRFAGGYVGVDVFFVLSGFLVTQVLLRDLADGGSVRFGRFYARRFRRLLPAAFVALVGTALLVTVVSPSEAVEALGAFKAAFLYVANWYFIRESADYFAAEVVASPVLPFWSLAVEEQFYLLWPLTLGAIFWVARRLRAHQALLVRGVVAIGALASVAWALSLRVDQPNRAYFGTDARAYQLLAGASIALLPGLVRSLGRFRRSVRWAAPVALLGIVVLGTSLGPDDPILRGIAVTVVVVAALVALEVADGGIAARLLSIPPVVYLGRISYGTYLWHWPVIIVATTVMDLDDRATAVLACLVATGLASLSYQVLEQPVRASALLDRHRLVVIGAGLTISVVAALVIIPAIVAPDPTAEAAAPATDASAFTPVPSWLNTSAIYTEGFGLRISVYGESEKAPSCLGAPSDQCTTVHGSGRHLLLMGDSNAVMMMPALTRVAEEQDLTLSLLVANGCPWQRDVFDGPQEVQTECREIKDDAYGRVIPALDPDVILVVNSEDVEDKPKSGETRRSEIEANTRASIAELAGDHRRVVVLEHMPNAPEGTNPLKCLETAPVVEDCRFIADADPNWFEVLTREIASSDPRVLSADFDEVVCPYFPICDPIIGDVVVKWDRQHVTTRFSKTMAEPIAAYLRANELIDT